MTDVSELKELDTTIRKGNRQLIAVIPTNKYEIILIATVSFDLIFIEFSPQNNVF